MKPKSFLAKSIATLIATTVTLTSVLHALPQGAQVQSGTATFSQSGGALNIQTSDRAIINYQSFSIGGAERVNFIQPSTLSLTLNRVTAPNPSQILGTLTSNGKIVLANPYGIFFGSGAVVNVGGIIAGAGRISDADFLAGKMNFTDLSGDVENRGRITAVTDVGLYGAHVSNEGVITSQKGSVTLAAGSSVFVGEAGGNIFVGTAPTAIPKARVVSKPGVSNTGRIAAPKASLVAGDMFGMAIAQSGTIISGDITISAGKGGSVDVSGRLDASNRTAGKTGGEIKVKGDIIAVRSTATLDASGNAGGGTILLEGGHNPTMPTTVTSSGRLLARGEGSGAKGGTVKMLGDHVGLFDQAVVDVSGDGGGGTALVGGDYQGKNPNIQNAERTYISLDAQIRADALSSGDGGKVIVWSDEVTRFYGTVSAQGGSLGGNGGFVETSGHYLEFNGNVNTGAANGRTGTLLLDPQILDANNTGGANYSDTVNNRFANNVGLTTTIKASGAGSISAQIAAVILQANSDVIFTDAVNIANLGTALTVQAGRSILINNNITTNGGNITMTANETLANGVQDADRLAGAGGITMAGGTTLASTGGDISLTVSTGTGVTLRQSGDISLVNVNAGAGFISVVNNGPVGGGTAGISVTGTLTTAGGAGGTVTLNAGGSITGGGNILTTGANASQGVAGGAINVTANSGAVTLGTFTARGGDSSGANPGGVGGAVTIIGIGGTAGFGAIDARAGSAGTGNQTGAVGGNVSINISGAGGNLGTSTITTTGGDGSGNRPGGKAGSVGLTASGTLTAGAITATGGTAGATGNGGAGNTVTVTGTGAGTVTLAAINTSGANGGGTGNNDGGDADNITIKSNGATVALNGAITAVGGLLNAGGSNGANGTLALGTGAGANSVGGITQTGVITAGTLTGNSSANINLTGAVNAISGLGAITASTGFSLDNGTTTIVLGAAITTTNSPVSLTADDMNLAGGTISSGSGSVTLSAKTANQVVTIGGGATGLGLTNAELNNITTSGTIIIATTGSTGTISTDGNVTLVTPTGGLTLNTSGGNITLNNNVSVQGVLTANTTNGGATTGQVNGTGVLISTTAQSLSATAATGITLGGASTVRGVSLTNTRAGNISYTGSAVGAANTLTVSGATNTVAGSGGSFTVTETTGSLAIGAADIVTKSGVVNLTASGTDESISSVVGSNIQSNATGVGAAVNLTADNMSLAGSTTSGTGVVTLTANAAGQIIHVGAGATDTATELGLTDTELNTITTTGGITVGGAANTGGIVIVGNANPTGLTGSGGAFSLTTGGAITRTAGTLSTGATAVNLSLNAHTGIGILATPIVIGAVTGNLSAVNGPNAGGSGNIALSTPAITLGSGTVVIDEQIAGGTISVVSSGAITLAGNVNVSGGGASTVTLNAAGSITRTGGTVTAQTVNLTSNAASGIGTNVARIATAASTLNLSAGTGGAFVNNTGSVTLATPIIGAGGSITVTSTGTLTLPAVALTLSGAGAIDFESNGGALTTNGALTTVSGGITLVGSTGLTVGHLLTSGSGQIDLSTTTSGAVTIAAGGITSTSGPLTITSRDAVGVAVAINTGSGTVAIDANTDGAGAEGFSQTAAAGTITTSNASAAAVAINVNAAGGGTGGAALRGITTGAGGTITVATGTGGNSTGGSITQTALTLLDSGAGGSVVLSTGGAASGIGTLAANILTTTDTVTAAGGSGGVFITETDGANFTVTATLAGGIRLTSTSGTLNIAGPTATGTGNIILSSGDDVTLNANVGGAGSGTIAINANTDGAGAEGFAQSVAAGSITTTNATATAVAINVNAAGGGTGGAALRNITTGAGGTITVATDTGANATGGSITQTAATTLNVGAAGTLTLSVPSVGASSVGTVANNILSTSAGGTLNLTAGSGGAFVTNTGNLTLAAPTLNANSPLSVISSGTLTLPAVAIATGTGDLTLRSNGGTLTTAGALSTTSGSITLAGSGGLSIGHNLTTTLAAGDLTLASTNNPINQTLGTIAVFGTTTASAGAGAITLTQLLNNFTGPVNASNTGANAIQLTDTNAIVLGTVNTANNLTVNALGITQNAGGLTVGGISTFNGGLGVITLTTAGNDFTGAVSLNNSGANTVRVTDANDIVLGASTVGQDLFVNVKGNINQAGALVVPGTSTFTIDTVLLQDVLLAGFNNNLTGAVTIATTGGATLRDVGLRNISGVAAVPLLPATLRNLDLQFINTAVTLPTINLTGMLNVLAGGAITQAAGGVQVTGVTTLNSGANAITLTDVLNDFTGAVSLNNSGANTVRITDANDIVLGASTVGQDLFVNVKGNISQTGALVVPGTSTFTVDTGLNKDVLLAGFNNNFTGTVTIATTGGATLRDVGLRNISAAAAVLALPPTLRNLDLQFINTAVTLPTINLTGMLNVLAGGAITQAAGGVQVTGVTTLNSGANAITLTDAANDFTGAVNANNTGANAIQLTDANAILLGTVNTANDLTVSAVGITQNVGGLTVGGTSTFNGGAGVITLTSAANDFTGAVNANNTGANAIQLTDANAILLGTVNTANDLTVSAVGITQNVGGLTVGGTSTFNGGAGVITLTSAANDFTGAVNANNTGANAIQLTDANAILLGTVNTANDLTVSAVGITQNVGGLTVGGTSTFNGGAGVITLTAAANDFTGAVNANNTGANAIQLTDANAILLGTVNTANDLTVSAVGITQNVGGLTVGGTSTFNGGAGVITLTSAANDFTGAVNANNTGANAIQLTDANAILLGTVNTANDLTVSAVGITQNVGGLTVGGTSTFNGGAGVITLTAAANDFTGVVNANNTGANAIQLTDANAILLGTVNTANDLTVSAVGITQNVGGLTVGGTSTFNGGAGVITLTAAANDFTGAVNANNTGANAIQLTDANAILLGTVTTANVLTVIAPNGITQTALGAITADTLNLTTTNASAVLNTATNFVTNLGTVSLGTGALNLLDAGGLTVMGVVGATGGVTLNTSGTLAIDNAVNAGGGNVTLTASVGNITQSGAGVLSGALLSATANTGSVLLDTLANNFATFTANATGAGQAVRYRDTDAFAIAAPGILTDAATGGVVLQSQNAAGTASGAITQTGEILGAQLAVRAAQPGGSATLTNALNTPFVVAANVAGNFLYTNANAAGLQVGTVDGVLGITTPAAVTLTALQGNLTQTQAIVGPASSVSATSTLGAVDLTNAGNAFAVLTGSSALNFSAVDSVALTVGAGGITANGGNVVSLTVNGAGNSLSLTGLVTGGTVNLFANTDITQTAAGGVVAPNLQAVATNGQVNLVTGAANNNVGTIAGRANLDFTYLDNNSPALSVGTVTTIGVTSTTGDVVITAVNGSLAVNQNVNAIALGGDVTLQSQNNLTLNAAVSASPVNGVVGLTSVAGSIIENFGGTVLSAQLRANAAINVDLAQLNSAGSNGFAARGTTGFVAFFNTGPILLDQVGATSGVTAGSAVVLLNTAGDITQTANGIITTGTGLLMQSVAGSITLDRANLVTGNFAVVGTTAGDITLRNTGLINIGAVGPFATSVPIGTFSGIGGGVTRFLSLTSDTGVITQDAGALDRIITGDLRVQTTGMNATLTNPANEIASVGTVALGAGAFRLVDSTLGLLVNGDVTANGGVDIRTAGGALSVTALPGTVTANAGNILLRSADSDVLLAGVLTASGLVQLDAGGAITQAGTGSIAGLSLIARAAGNVTLNQAANDVTNLAGSSATGTFSYRDATAITVATVNDATTPVPVVGITTANRDITVVGGAGNVAVSAALNAGAGTVRLQSNAGNVTQTAPITAGNLLANAAGGSVFLSDAANSITMNVAGATSGAGNSFRFRNNGSITVGNVSADAITGPAAANGITTDNGDVALLAAGSINLIDRINAAGGGAMAAGSSGVVRLQSDTGDITQSATGVIVANSLLVNAASATGGITLNSANDVITAAANSGTGGFLFQDPTGVAFDRVGEDGSIFARADGSTATPGLITPSSFLPIGALTGVTTTGPTIINSLGTVNFAVPMSLGGSLIVNAPTIDLNGAGMLPTDFTVRTNGGQTYNGSVVLTANQVLTDLAPTGAIRFLSTVDSDAVMPWSLAVNTAGITEFNGLVGNTRALLSVATDVFGTVRFNAAGTDLAPTVRTTTFQTYSDAALLVLDTVLSSTLGGNLTFGSAVDSAVGPARALRVNSTGNEIFNGVVGGSLALLNLVADGDATLRGGQAQFNMTVPGLVNPAGVSAGSVTVNDTAFFNVGGSTTVNPSVQTTGGTPDAQTYNGAVILNADAVLNDTASANIVFNSTVNSAPALPARALEVNTGGNEVFNGRVGNTAALRTLTTDASNLGGNVRFNAAGTTLAASVITTGLQTYNDDVRLGADVVLQSTGSGSITFGRTVNSDAAITPRALEVNTGGDEVFSGRVGDTAALRTLITDASNLGGNVRFNAAGTTPAASVITTGLQTYNDDARLGADVVLQSTGSGFITFNRTVNSDAALTPRALEVNTVGDEVFNGRVGDSAALRTLITDASNLGGNVQFNAAGTTGAASVITTGLQTYNDDARLGADVVLRSTGSGNIRFNRTVNSDTALTPRALEVNTGGVTAFGDGGADNVGAVAALRSLITDAGGSTDFNILGGTDTVRTTTFQTYNDSVRLVQNTVLTSTTAGDVTFTGSVDSFDATPRSLVVNTSGATRFGNIDGLAVGVSANATSGRVGGNFALLSLTTDEPAAAVPAAPGNITVFDIPGGSTGVPLVPTVRTTSFQTYNDAVTLPALSAAAVIASGGNVTFSRTVNGPAALSVFTSGISKFDANIGQTTPLASLATDALGTTILPAVVRTSGSQRFADMVSLAANTVLTSTGGGAIDLLSTVKSTVNTLKHSLTLSTNGSATLGATLSNLTSLTPSVRLTTTIGTAATTTNITVPGPLTFTGPVAILGNVEITTTTGGASAQTATSGASLRFNSTVDGPGSLTASSGGNLVLAGNIGLSTPLSTFTATAPFISLNSTRTVGDLKVDALTTIATSTDGSDGLVNLTGVLYSSLGGSVRFNPTNRTPISRHATILSNAGNVAISAAGDFFMGNEQKLLVNNGSLTVSAGGTATVGDMAASVSMNLTASAVVFQGRQLNGFFNSNRKDHGLGFVSPTIRFNSSAAPTFAIGTNPVVVFSTRDAVASVRPIRGLSTELDKDIALQFNKQDLKLGPAPFFLPVEPNVTFGTVQPIASGTRVTEPGQIQVTFVLEIPKVVELPQDTFLSKSDQDILKRMGIYPREATSDENITVSLKRGVFRQPIEGKAEMDDPEYSVVLNRLTNEEVRKIIEAYVAVAGKDPADIDKIATLLDDQVKKFHAEVPGAKGLDGFTKWLQGNLATDKGAAELAKNLDELSAVFVQLSQVGLTKKEVAICKAKICLALDKSGLGSDEIATLVEGAAKLPPQAPRPAVTAPPPTAPAAPVDVPPASGVPVPPAPEPLAPSPEPGAPAPGGAATPPPPPADAPTAPKAQ